MFNTVSLWRWYSTCHRYRTTRRYRYDLLWELAHMDMEAETSCDPSVSWRTRKTSGISQYKSKDLRIRGEGWCYNSWFKSQGPRTKSTDVQGEEKMNISAQAKTANLPFLFFFFFSFEGWAGRKRNIDVREKHWLVDFHMCPKWGLNLQPTHVSWPGIEPVTFWFMGWCPTNWATEAREFLWFFVLF